MSLILACLQYSCCDIFYLVNGNWGEWSTFGVCSKTCGGGEKLKKRSCNNPSSANDGLDCLLSGENEKRGKEEHVIKTCNTDLCPGNHIIYSFLSPRILFSIFHILF